MNPCGNDLEADPASKIAGIVRGLSFALRESDESRLVCLPGTAFALLFAKIFARVIVVRVGNGTLAGAIQAAFVRQHQA